MKARRKKILFTPDLIQEWMIEGSEMTANTLQCVIGIPNDAVFVRGYYDPRMNVYAAIFDHPTWEEVEDDGRDLPTIEIQIASIYGEALLAENVIKD